MSGNLTFPTAMGTVSGTVVLEGDWTDPLCRCRGCRALDNLFVDKCTTGECGVTVSSTLEMLGRLYLMNGTVVTGQQLEFPVQRAGTGVLDAIPATADLSEMNRGL